MAQYTQSVAAATENVTSGLSATATTAITEILAAATTGNTDGAVVASVAAGEVLPTGADVIVVGAGVEVAATDADVIVAAPGAALVVTSLAPTGVTRAVVGGDEPDAISTGAAGSAKLPQKEGTATDDNVIVEAAGGDDTVTTGSGNDSVTGGAGNDSISTGAGNDVITIGSGADTVDAGSGIDAIISTQASTEVDISIDTQGKITLTDKSTGDITTIDNAEYIEFSDNVSQLTTSTDVDTLVDSSLAKAFSLEVSQGGLKAFDGLSAGTSNVSALVSSYVTSDTFKTDSSGVTDIDVLANLVYKGVFGVDAGGETLNLWSAAIKTGLTASSTTTASASEAQDVQIIGTTQVSFDEI